jgi:hypothetical protein
MVRWLQREGCNCRHIKHVTADRSEQTVTSIKAMVRLDVCEEGDLLCTAADTSFRRGVLVENTNL